MKCDEVCTESIAGIFGIDDFGEVEWVDANIGIEAEADIAATDGVTEFLIFVFGVDNNDFRTYHHGAEGFELDGEGFTGARFGKDYHIGIFERETVKDNKTVIMHIDAI